MNCKYNKILTKEFLQQEYIINKKSRKQIGKELNIDPWTIRNYLLKHKINIRNISEALFGNERLDINKEILLKLYLEQELSIRDIAKFFKCTHTTIRRKIKQLNIPIRKTSEVIKKFYTLNPDKLPVKKGSKRSDQIKQKIALSKIGKSISIETKKKLSERFKGKNSHFWRGGLIQCKCDCCGMMIYKNKYNFFKYLHHFCGRDCRNKFFIIDKKIKFQNRVRKYPSCFNNKLKQQIRKRDNFTCQNCGMVEEEHINKYKRKLDIHHIDHNKNNCLDDNLITLCRKCNIKANNNENFWEIFYKGVVDGITIDDLFMD